MRTALRLLRAATVRLRIGAAAVGLAVLATAVIVPGSARSGPVAPPNSGEAGAPCRAEQRAGYTLPPSDVRADPFGDRGPAYSELTLPRGRARGVMLQIVTGGWYLVGPQVVSASRDVAVDLRSQGWIVLSITTRGCGHSVADALWFHDALRRRFGSRLPLCTTGASAGGHLALMVAARRADVGCAITLGAPTDLPALRAGLAFDPVHPAGLQNGGPLWLYRLAVAAFGRTHLAVDSPRHYAARIRARLLVALAGVDPYVARGQATRLVAAVLRHDPGHDVETVVLPPPSAGDRVPVCHGATTQAGVALLRARLDALLARVTGRRPARAAGRPIACPPPFGGYAP